MSDEEFEVQPEGGIDPTSIGDRLRRAREERGLSLDDVASHTRIPIRHLQHIEQQEWDALPGTTYCVGFVRAYANMIGLDGAEMSRQLRDQLGDRTSRAPAPQYYEPADPSRVPPRSLAMIAGIIAVVLIALYAIWRSSLGDGEAPVTDTATPEAATPAPQPTGPPAPPRPAAVAGQPVTLSATGEVWLRITDQASGGTLFSGIMQPGQSFQVPATAQQPILRTGRPQVLRVSIGGRDLGPLEPVERTIDNVSLRPEDLAARGQAAPAVPAAPVPPAP